MKTLKYKVIIEDGINRSLKNFETEVKKILTDKRSWPINFVQDQYNYDFEINLSKPKTIKNICKFSGLSCADRSTNKVYINNYRWIKGSKASKHSIKDYRFYVILHECFHILGFGHSLPIKGEKVAISVQQTLSIGEAKKNHFPLQWEIDWVNKKWNNI